jgi:hypothetical protein
VEAAVNQGKARGLTIIDIFSGSGGTCFAEGLTNSAVWFDQIAAGLSVSHGPKYPRDGRALLLGAGFLPLGAHFAGFDNRILSPTVRSGLSARTA